VTSSSPGVTASLSARPLPAWRRHLAQRGLDRVTLLMLPACAFIVLLFVYPFIYGFVLSFHPKAGDWLANYRRFFSDPFLYDTIGATLRLAAPATIINVLLSIPVALRVRHMRRRRLLTTILVVPITLGTVLIAEGLLIYLGPQGWLNRLLMLTGIVTSPIRLVHNYWGVLISLIISGFPFTFLLTLSYVTGIDPSLEQAAATLGANARARFTHVILPLLAPGLAINICLSFVQTFSVFPSAVLLGAPAGATRVISIAAYQAAYEAYDASLASSIAMIMGAVQLAIVAAVLAARGLLYRGAVGAGKG
jgi:putative spermidine/putrescine transport system permease protein